MRTGCIPALYRLKKLRGVNRHECRSVCSFGEHHPKSEFWARARLADACSEGWGTQAPKLARFRLCATLKTRVAPFLWGMETPAPKSTGGASQKKEADKEKDKRLARCGKCINCKSTVRAHLSLPHSSEPAFSACGACVRWPARPSTPLQNAPPSA